MSVAHDGIFRLSVAKVNSGVYTLLGSGAVALAYSVYLGNVLIGLLVAAVCAGVAWWWRRKTVLDRSVKLALTSEGVHAPDVTEKPVPWSELRKVILSTTEVARRRAEGGMSGMIVLDVKGDVKQYGPREGKYFGGSSLTITVDELDGTLNDVMALLAQHAPGLEVLQK